MKLCLLEAGWFTMKNAQACNMHGGKNKNVDQRRAGQTGLALNPLA
jgi:hypothetical protein